MDELLDLARHEAARVFSLDWKTKKSDARDEALAYEITKYVDQLSFEEGERRVTLWSIDDTFVVVCAWAPGEQDPTFDAMVLGTWGGGTDAP